MCLVEELEQYVDYVEMVKHLYLVHDKSKEDEEFTRNVRAIADVVERYKDDPDLWKHPENFNESVLKRDQIVSFIEDKCSPEWKNYSLHDINLSYQAILEEIEMNELYLNINY